MEIKARAFPYPVLGPSSDDFTEGAIKLADATADAAPERYSLSFRFEVSHASIAEMIATGDASPAIVIECRQNLYRRRHAVQLGLNHVEISADELRGEVQVTPLISAVRDLENYRPSFLNADYNGVEIQVPRHGVLAYGANLEFIAEPRADRLRKISSIMRVFQKDDAGPGMTVKDDGDRIRVEVLPEQFRLYQSVASSREGSSILASMLVLPVLVHVFHRVKGDPEGLEEFRWFKIISLRLREIGQQVDAPDFDPMRAAQSLLDSPFARGISELFGRLGLGDSD